MQSREHVPLLDHATDSPSAFTPEALMESVRILRGHPQSRLPSVCVLDFDGDLTDWLVAEGVAKRCDAWACFHTTMYVVECGDTAVGVLARTIGGPYAVLIAEQLNAAGVRLTVGLTSAGRIASDLPLPCLVVATNAVRDEGTSFHYLPPSTDVSCPCEAVVTHLEHELDTTGWPVRRGRVWTTDAPYRETENDIQRWRNEGVLAVEMQAASLFAFGTAKHASVAVVAMVSNAVDHEGNQFNTGTQADGLAVLRAIARAGASLLGLAK